jgi:hypothetical protein
MSGKNAKRGNRGKPAKKKAPNRRAPEGKRKLRATTRSAVPEPPGFWASPFPVALLKNACALTLLAPICWITADTVFAIFAQETAGRGFWRSEEFWFFAVGAAMWLIAFWEFRKWPPIMWAYVWGHEQTHAIFARFSLGRVAEVVASHKGGYIVTDKSNVMVVLSPYFIPFWTVIVCASYGIISGVDYFWDIPPPLGIPGSWILFGAIGLTWCYHLTFTIWMITKEQPDLALHGNIFSLLVIALANLLLIAAMLIMASRTATWSGFGNEWLDRADSLVRILGIG